MKAKSGKKIEAVKPVDPEEVFDADDAVPGKIAEVKSAQKSNQSGKYGQTKLPAHKSSSEKTTGSESTGASSATKGGDETGSIGIKAQDTTANSQDDDKEDTSWISIKLIDEEGDAIVGEKYEVILPNGTLAKGTLGTDGTAKVKGFDPGACKVSFPSLVSGSVSKK